VSKIFAGGARMVKSTCINCGAETFRLVFNEPLCHNCDPASDGVVILRDQMYAAKEEYWKAMDDAEQFHASIRDRTHGVPFPDSVQMVQNLGKRTVKPSQHIRRR